MANYILLLVKIFGIVLLMAPIGAWVLDWYLKVFYQRRTEYIGKMADCIGKAIDGSNKKSQEKH